LPFPVQHLTTWTVRTVQYRKLAVDHIGLRDGVNRNNCSVCDIDALILPPSLRACVREIIVDARHTQKTNTNTTKTTKLSRAEQSAGETEKYIAGPTRSPIRSYCLELPGVTN
jgi:hypothetical protein